MKKEKVWRYYCDHCGKGGCNAGHMAKHEAKCLRNPVRNCGLCLAKSVDQIKLAQILDSSGLEALKDAADYCPACILAAILQSKRNTKEWVDYNYSDEAQQWRNERIREEIEADAYP